MKLRKVLIFIILGISFFYGLTSKAATMGFLQDESQSYLSGKELCELGKEEFLSKEYGHFVKAPVDFNDRSSENMTTQIYYWTRQKFNPSLPSVVYINGGPGSSAHETTFLNTQDFNIIFFDQRGVACSRGDTEQIQYSPKFYSIEAMARDLDLIRKDLKISKWTIYAHSFGTTVGTVYASFFPKNTQALILEGTIFIADATIWFPEHRLKLMQRYYNSLPEELKKYVLAKYKENPEDSFFFGALQSFMYGNNFESEFTKYLMRLYEYDVKTSNRAPRKIFDKNLGTKSFYRSDFTQNQVAWAMMMCKYLSATNSSSSSQLEFRGEKIFSVENKAEGIYRKQLCLDLGVEAQSELDIYRAEKYPVKVPTTYFHGANDGATAFPHPSNHYKKVSKGSRQILIMPGAGHSPQLSLLTNSDFDTKELSELDKDLSDLQSKIFKKAALGQKIEAFDIEGFNFKSPLVWKLHNKNF